MHENDTKQRTGRIYPADVRKIWMLPVFSLACALIMGKMAAKAEPAALESMSAVVYEQASKESNPVGNLIQGSTFDLQGTVTAEDGSTWYIAVTSNGVQGYFQGDIRVGASTEEAAPQPAEDGNTETQTPPEEAGETGEPAAAEEQTEIPAEEETPEEENIENQDNTETAGNTEAEEAAEIEQIENLREKTYALNADKIKIKIPEETADTDSALTEEKDNFFQINTAFLFFLIVLVFSASIACASYKRIKKDLNGGADTGTALSGVRRADKNKRAARKKKKHKKKKGKNRKSQARKQEIIKKI